MTQAEGILEYPSQAEGFGRRLADASRVHWVIPEVARAEAEQPTLAETGVWQFPPGLYQISILGDDGLSDERRVLLGDRRRRHREVDRDSLAFEERGSGDRRLSPDEPGWH